MNTTSAERISDKKIYEEPQVSLQKVFKKMQINVSRLQKCMGLCKEVINECCDKLEELHSQMTELEAMIEKAVENDELRFLGKSLIVETLVKLSDY